MREGDRLRVAASRGGDADVELAWAAAGSLRRVFESKRVELLADGAELLPPLGHAGRHGHDCWPRRMVAQGDVVGALLAVLDPDLAGRASATGSWSWPSPTTPRSSWRRAPSCAGKGRRGRAPRRWAGSRAWPPPATSRSRCCRPWPPSSWPCPARTAPSSTSEAAGHGARPAGGRRDRARGGRARARAAPRPRVRPARSRCPRSRCPWCSTGTATRCRRRHALRGRARPAARAPGRGEQAAGGRGPHLPGPVATLRPGAGRVPPGRGAARWPWAWRTPGSSRRSRRWRPRTS